MDVASHSRRYPEGEHLDDAADRVAGFVCVVDRRHHCCLDRPIERAHWRCVDRVGVRRRGAPLASYDTTNRNHMADDRNSNFAEELLCQVPGDSASCGFSRRGPFEDVASVVGVIFHHSGKVGVTRPRCPERARRAALADGHLFFPLGPLGVADKDGHGRAEGSAKTHAAEDLNPILLDGHPSTPPVAESTPGEFIGNARSCDLDTRRQSLDHRDQTRPMRLPSSEKPKHRRMVRIWCLMADARHQAPGTRHQEAPDFQM